MPITQGRMIALINAAEDYKSALITVEQWLVALQSRAYALDQSQLTAEIQILTFNVGDRIQELVKHDATIITEYNRFRQNYGRNERERLKQQIKRREAGVQSRAQPRMHYNERDKLLERNNTSSAPAPTKTVLGIAGRVMTVPDPTNPNPMPGNPTNPTRPRIPPYQQQINNELDNDPIYNTPPPDESESENSPLDNFGGHLDLTGGTLDDPSDEDESPDKPE